MLVAFNQGEKFVLAIAIMDEGDRALDGPHYGRNPFDREPGWGIASINYLTWVISWPSRSRNMTTQHPVKAPKKLIEVALPLIAINEASVRESYIYRANPSSLHKWWAQRPMAAARAVLFAQLVNDPSWKWEMENAGEVPPSHLKASWAASRKRLFAIIEELITWENTTNEDVFDRARSEILKSGHRAKRDTCEIAAFVNRDHSRGARN